MSNYFDHLFVINIANSPGICIFIILVSVNHQPAIGDCSVKLYAKRTPSSAETVVGEATCAADGVDPLTVFVGAGLDFSRDDKGITKLEVNWKAEYDDPLPMPSRPSGANFFVSNAPVQIGISGGSFTISFDG